MSLSEQPSAKPSRAQSITAWACIGVLVIVGIAVWAKQYRYDAGLYQLDASQSGKAAAPAGVSKEGEPQPTEGDEPRPAASKSAALIASFVPAETKPMGTPESFGKEKLSDKIDGKAELYIENGFVSMDAQRFVLEANPNAWFEVFVYDMGAPLNAFSVFSTQRRPGGRELDFGQFAYATENSVFLVHGKWYVEILAAQAGDALMKAVESTARVFVQKTNVGNSAELAALPFFPPEGADKSSIKLYQVDAFSFDKLTNVLTMNYSISGTTTTAFASARKDPAEAAELVEAYSKLITTDLAGETLETTGVEGARMFNVLGDFEIVFARGPVLAGVHATKDKTAAEQCASRLDAWIREKLK